MRKVCLRTSTCWNSALFTLGRRCPRGSVPPCRSRALARVRGMRFGGPRSVKSQARRSASCQSPTRGSLRALRCACRSQTRNTRRSVALVAAGIREAEPVQHLVDRHAVDAGGARGGRDVAVVLREQPRDVAALELADHVLLGQLERDARRRPAPSSTRRPRVAVCDGVTRDRRLGCAAPAAGARRSASSCSGDSASSTARSITLRSSRTLPGQSCFISRSIVSCAIDAVSPPGVVGEEVLDQQRRCRRCARAAAARGRARPRAGSRGPRGTGRG